MKPTKKLKIYFLFKNKEQIKIIRKEFFTECIQHSVKARARTALMGRPITCTHMPRTHTATHAAHTDAPHAHPPPLHTHTPHACLSESSRPPPLAAGRPPYLAAPAGLPHSLRGPRFVVCDIGLV